MLLLSMGERESQGYSGKADWNIIRDVKNSVKIPVIGNGDVTSPEKAKEMLDFTGCDAVMIGRAALGNPWLIRNTVLYLEGKPYTLPTTNDKIEMCIKHLKMLSDLKSEKQAVLEIRSHVGWYLKGVKGSNDIKNKIYKMTKICDILQVLEEFKEELYEKKNVYDKIKEEEEKINKKNKVKKSPDIKAMFSQRVLAFLIDLVLISIITSLITMFVPVNDTATKLYEEQNRVLEGYVEGTVSMEEYVNQMVDLSYDISRQTVIVSIVTIVISLLYYVVYPCYNNGQTLVRS